MHNRRPLVVSLQLALFLLLVIHFTCANYPYNFGSISTSLSVSDQGSFVTSSLIELPPGPRALQPQLSIESNSRSDRNGILGQSFRLSLGSLISPCPKTWAQDGEAAPPILDGTGPYCLDGQRLIPACSPANGTQLYWIARELPSKKVSTRMKIMAYYSDQATSLPNSWVITTSKGVQKFYGTTNDSRVIGHTTIRGVRQEVVRVWLMNRVEDALSNYYSITYQVDSNLGEYFPLLLEWTGNERAGVLPYNQARFFYLSRSDVSSGFLQGLMYTTSHLLSSVVTYTEDVMVRNYSFSYERSCLNGGSRLVSMQACANDSISCLQPTYFAWDEVCQGSLSSEEESPISGFPISIFPATFNTFFSPLARSRMKSGDFNGDGLSDWLILGGSSEWPSSNQSVIVFLNNGDGTWTNFTGPTISMRTTVGAANVDAERLKCFDIDGDGDTDLWWLNGGEEPDIVYYSEGNGFSSSIPMFPTLDLSGVISQDEVTVSSFFAFDFNSDSLIDVMLVFPFSNKAVAIWLNGGKGQSWISTPGPALPIRNTILLAKLDLARIRCFSSQGRGADVYLIGGDTGEQDSIYFNPGDGNFTGVSPSFGPTTIQVVLDSETTFALFNVSRVRITDLNRDGYQDFVILPPLPPPLQPTSQPSTIILNQGNGEWLTKGDGPSISISPTLPQAQIDLSCVFILDITGDSFPDFLLLSGLPNSQDTLYVNQAGDGNFIPFSTGNTLVVLGTNINEASFNLSLLVPGFWLMEGAASFYLALINRISNNTFLHQHISSVADGFGHEAIINYKPLTDPSVYRITGTSSFPVVVDRSAFVRVVSDLFSSDGIGGMKHQNYYYENHCLHVQGYGDLGFQYRTVNDVTNFKITTTSYSQDISLQQQLVVLSEATWLVFGNDRGSRLLSNTSYTYATSFGDGCTAPLLSILKVSTTAERYDPFFQEWMGTEVTARNFDDYGNIISSNTTSIDPYTTLNTLQTREFLINEEQWLISLLVAKTTIMQRNNLPPEPPRTTIYEVDPSTGLRYLICERAGTAFPRNTSIDYDFFGNQISTEETAPQEVPRLFKNTYDPYGRFAVASMDPSGATSSSIWDSGLGVKVFLSDPNNLTTQFVYDPFKNLQISRHPDGTQSSIARFICFGPNNNGPCQFATNLTVSVTQTTSVSGQQEFAYEDTLRRTIRTVRQGYSGVVLADISYDSQGNPIATSSPYYYTHKPTVYWTAVTYDELARPVKVALPDGTTTRTVYNGLKTTTYNQLNQTTTKVLDSGGLLLDLTDDTGNTTTWTYDAWGNVLSISDSGGHEDRYQYDDVGRLTFRLMSDAEQPELFEYDGFDRVVVVTTPQGSTQIWEYDALDRKTSLTASDMTAKWIWDSAENGVGKLAMTIGWNIDSYIETNFTYDPLSRLVGKTVSVNGGLYQSTQGFDKYSRVSSYMFPTGFQIYYNYNETNGYLQSISSGQITIWAVFEMDPSDRILSSSKANTIFSYLYDEMGRVISINTKTPERTIFYEKYYYDPVGNIASKSNGSDSTLYEYDSLNRLITVRNVDEATLSISYGLYGRVSSRSDVGHFDYNETVHAPTSVSGTTETTLLSYDLGGNLVLRGNVSISWTSTQLPFLITNGVDATDFRYGPDQQRFLRVDTTNNVNTTTVYFDVDGESGGGSFEEVFFPDGTRFARCYVSGILVACGETSTSMFVLHSDHLGSVVLVTDHNGSILEKNNYGPFGNVSSFSAESYNNGSRLTMRSFTGEEAIGLFNLVHMNGRVYDPTLQMFLSIDPKFMQQQFQSQQSLNPYTYASNNPLTLSDPTGYGWFSKLFHSITRGVGKLLHEISHIPVLNSIEHMFVMAIGDTICGPICAAASDAIFDAFMARLEGASWSQALKEGAVEGAIDLIAQSKLPQFEKFTIGGTLEGLSVKTSGGSFVSGFVRGATLATNSLGNTQLVTSSMSLVKVVDVVRYSVGQYEFQRAATWFAHKMGMSLDELDLGLELLSIVGGPRGPPANGPSSVEGGWGTHSSGYAGLPFDIIDTALVLQGLPSATELSYMIQGASILQGGHSLGAAGAELLNQYGFVQSPVVMGLPFVMQGSLPAVTVYYRGGDFSAGGPLIQNINHLNFLSDSGGGHGYSENYGSAYRQIVLKQHS